MEPFSITHAHAHVIYCALDDDREAVTVVVGTLEQAEQVARDMTAQAVKDAVDGGSYASRSASMLYHYVEGTVPIRSFAEAWAPVLAPQIQPDQLHTSYLVADAEPGER